ncbi:MAG: protein kinase [Planctomycetota bacterium]
MTSNHGFGRLKELALEALSRTSEERRAFLDEHCQDPELRITVEKLISAAETESSFLEPPDLGPTLQHLPAEKRLGAYELIEVIDSGGMGTVYRARRADGAYEQEVAIKLIRAGLLSASLRARFERERQLLARLQHPYITRLIDGGTTADGQPYLVMEFVQGAPILQHCHQTHLTLRERLLLFLEVCEAVEHAHRNLIVHRDLKPSNVLITEDGEPKLLDFGIAKLLDPETETTDETQTLLRALTPAYASPEQLRDEPVTTASDVYSLGVLLYELVTDRHPHDLEGCTPGEAKRVICASDPVRPSQAHANRPKKRRGPGAASWSRRLKGDLDNVVLKALRKEPGRRYATVEHLADDLRRYLENLPVRARRATPLYRMGKLVRRHPFGVGTVATLLLVIAAAFGGLSAGFARAEEQRLLAEEARKLASRDAERALNEARRSARVLGFLREMLLFGNGEEGRRSDMTVREMLDSVADSLERLEVAPDTRTTLHSTLGAAYHGLGLFDLAEAHLRLNVKLAREHFPDQPRRAAEAHSNLAGVLLEQHRLEEAERQIASASERAAELGDDDPVWLNLLNIRGLIHRAQARYADSEADLRRALALVTELGKEGDIDPLLLKQNLAEALTYQNEKKEARELLEDCASELRANLPTATVKLASVLNNLASIVSDSEGPLSAVPYYQETLELYETVYDGEHPHVAIALNNLAKVHEKLGELDRAQALYERSLGLFEHFLGNEHPNLAVVQLNLGSVHEAQEDWIAAKYHMEKALEIQVNSLPLGHPATATTRHSLGLLLHRLGEW